MLFHTQRMGHSYAGFDGHFSRGQQCSLCRRSGHRRIRRRTRFCDPNEPGVHTSLLQLPHSCLSVCRYSGYICMAVLPQSKSYIYHHLRNFPFDVVTAIHH